MLSYDATISSLQRPCICLPPLKGVTKIGGLAADTPLFWTVAMCMD
jgi:hypothetical protein